MNRAGRLRSRLETLFVVFHVVAMLVLALPGGRRMGDRRVWQSAVYREDREALATQLRRMGVDWGADGLERRLWSLTQAYLSVRSKLAAPFRPYASVAQLSQSWRMFSSPQRRPAVLHVEVRREDEAFKPVFIARSNAYVWRRSTFDHNRVRKLLGRFARSRDRRRYHHLARFLAHAAARDFPNHVEARVRLARFRSLRPDQVRAGRQPRVRFEGIRTFNLGAMR